MKIEIDIDYEVLDEIVHQRLKEALEDCSLFASTSYNYKDKDDYLELVKALKVVMKYFEVPTNGP